MAKIDLDFFEKVIFQQCMKCEGTTYLASCVEFLDKSIFKDKNIGAIIQIIKTFYVERDVVPTLTELKTRITTTELKTQLKAAVEAIQGIDKTFNEDELIKNTEYFLKQRKYYNLIEAAVMEHVDKKEIDSESIQKEVDKINSISLIDNLGLDYFGEIDKVVAMLLETDTLISTGYRGLDAAFGGIQREGKAMYNIAGETNVGKSIFLANIAVNLVNSNEPTLIISPEMSEKRLAKRISGILTGIAIKTLPENIENFKEYIRDFISDHLAKLKIKEFATKSTSAKGVKAFIEQLKKKRGFNPAAILVDGHSLFKPSIGQPSKHAEVQFIVQEFRGLSYWFGAPIISVAQLNRSSHKQDNPGLDTMSSSWDQNSDFDGMVNIWQTDTDREAKKIKYGGKKARDDEKGMEGAMDIDYNTLRLTEEAGDFSPSAPDTSALPENNISSFIDFDSLGLM